MLFRSRFDPTSFGFLEIGDQRVAQLVRTYNEAPTGSLFVLVDSSGYLEIAANQASAAAMIGCAAGDPITVHLVQKE